MESSERLKELFSSTPRIINIGLSVFFDSLMDQDIQAIQVNWQPPAGGDEEFLDFLDEVLDIGEKPNRTLKICGVGASHEREK